MNYYNKVQFKKLKVLKILIEKSHKFFNITRLTSLAFHNEIPSPEWSKNYFVVDLLNSSLIF